MQSKLLIDIIKKNYGIRISLWLAAPFLLLLLLQLSTPLQSPPLSLNLRWAILLMYHRFRPFELPSNICQIDFIGLLKYLWKVLKSLSWPLCWQIVALKRCTGGGQWPHTSLPIKPIARCGRCSRSPRTSRHLPLNSSPHHHFAGEFTWNTPFN